MKNFPVIVNDKEFWISRSISVEGFIFTFDNGLRILANKRGKNCPNNVGKWNCPCGYLDYDETIKQACMREIKEETNLTVDPSLLYFLNWNDLPKGNTQNICFTYWSYKDTYSFQTVTGGFADNGEVDDVEWIGVDKLDNYDWAFEHNYKIMSVALRYLSNRLSEETKRRFEKQLKERNILGTNA